MPNSHTSGCGGDGSATFEIVSRRSIATKSGPSPVSSSANVSARASTRRESWFEITVPPNDTSASASANAGRNAGVPGAAPVRAAQRFAQRLTTHIAAGATSATHSMPLGTSRPLTWPSSCATTSRTSEGLKSLAAGVVENDALRVAEPGHVGVCGGRAAGGVHDQHVAHVHAGPVGQRDDVRAGAPGRKLRRTG